MTLNLDHLKQIASAATQGPWHQGAHYIGAGDDPHAPEVHVGNSAFLQDARHIATFDPPTVLALIDRIRELEAEIRKAKAQGWDEGYWLGINRHTGPGNPYTLPNCTTAPYTEES